MDIHSDAADAVWKNAGGKSADLEALRAAYGPGASFAELASHRDLSHVEALRSFGGGGGVVAATTVPDVVVIPEPVLKSKPAAKPKRKK